MSGPLAAEMGRAAILTQELSDGLGVCGGQKPSNPDMPMNLSANAAERAAIDEAIDRALEAAGKSGKAGIAAAILLDGRTVATGENEVHLRSDPTKHAEMVAIARAAEALQTTDLSDCVIVSTLQPCEMCLAAIRFAGISRVIFSATQGNVASKYFAFPHLRIEDFQNGEDFAVVAGVGEARVLHLYADGAE